VTNLPDVPNAESLRPEAVPPPPPPQKPCRKCESMIDDDAKKCSVCGALQAYVECHICKELIPSKALYCNGCKSYQPWLLRFFSFSSTNLALITAVLSLLVALGPRLDEVMHRNSDTAFTVTGADAKAIYVLVINSGRKASIIREGFLMLDNSTVPVEFLHSNTQEGKNLIHASSEQAIGLTVSGLSVKPPDGATVTLKLIIEESSGDLVPRLERFPAKRIREFIDAKTLEEPTP
jgi:RNA polymerase subunit RPABC4/transcription elongation factor Spt4